MLPWQDIHTVLLDMDGTLLDLHFDDHFFRIVVPQSYATANELTFEQAEKIVFDAYRAVEGTLAWYDVDYWSRTLKLDIPLLKKQVAHLIQVRPQVMPFLKALHKSGRALYLVTNAHGKSLSLKLEKTPIGAWFNDLITSHDMGCPKEDPKFWSLLQKRLEYDPDHTLLVEDSEKILAVASEYGPAHLLHIAKPSSQREPQFSQHFPSVLDFSALPSPDLS
ncbi:MAG: GMP/IMP nucleotidase [Magnetococcales bacterium]|nr:GMP/IMP nucleotidase [Magnetococcales bacterium]